MPIVPRSLLSIATALLLVACGGPGEAPPGGDAAAPAAPADLATLLSRADPEKGRVQFLQCRACHSLEEGGPNKVGPNLWGMFGQKAGFAAGFSYSEAITNADLVWTAEALDHWLERPSDFLPGNRMVFVGIRRPEDRADLIAYLKRETGAE